MRNNCQSHDTYQVVLWLQGLARLALLHKFPEVLDQEDLSLPLFPSVFVHIIPSRSRPDAGLLPHLASIFIFIRIVRDWVRAPQQCHVQFC